jgi:phosphoribosyl-AMP cyclohydrolase / phosphoribosyl-ATP pyrophosphohydrolase
MKLTPAIVQDALTGRVLMLGYMDDQALERTRATGRVTFFSRSKGRLWEKGETSGNFLEVRSIAEDCDADALLIQATPRGPTCHRGTPSCFDPAGGDGVPEGLGFLACLDALIEERKSSADPSSYTRKLLDRGLDRVAQKVGEEAVETVIAAKNADPQAFLGEAADLLFHLMVLVRARGASLDQLAAALRERHRPGPRGD